MRALLVVLLVLGAGCVAPEDAPSTAPTPAGGPLAVASSAFQDGAAIPRKHTCDGEAASPSFTITGAGNASTVALLMIDPDVPTPIAPQREFVHWLVWNVPVVGGAARFDEGAVPSGATQGNNGGGAPKYAGPCPPQGSPAHRYVFTVHAVDGALHLAAGSTREQLEAALKDHSLGTAKLTGTYARALVT
jgi:Raf kinase inhibitor-like YbhB/YbcL family protein